MGKVFLVASTLFVLVSCASGLSEAEVRELIQAEVAAISTGPQGLQGEQGPQGDAGPAGIVASECHTHEFDVGDGSHGHTVYINDRTDGGFFFGVGDGYAQEADVFGSLWSTPVPLVTDAGEVC